MSQRVIEATIKLKFTCLDEESGQASCKGTIEFSDPKLNKLAPMDMLTDPALGAFDWVAAGTAKASYGMMHERITKLATIAALAFGMLGGGKGLSREQVEANAALFNIPPDTFTPTIQ